MSVIGDETMRELREADPAPARVEQLEAGMAAPEAIREHAIRLGSGDPAAPALPGRPSRLRRVVVGAALVAAALFAAFALLPSDPEPGDALSEFETPRPPGDAKERTFSSAFGALTTASAAAAEAPPAAGGPIRYLSELVHESDLYGEGAITSRDGEPRPGSRYVIGETYESQAWLRADGSAHLVNGPFSGQEFPSAADERLWAEEGEPSFFAEPDPRPAAESEVPKRFDFGGADRLGFYGLKPAERKLPADPEKLAAVFASVTIDSSSAGAGDSDEETRGGDLVQTFDYASNLLLSPGAYDPELRAAAYEVIAGLDGVELRGRARDPVGRLGTSVSFVAELDRRPPTRYELIFDANTSEPLAYVREELDPRADSGSPVLNYEVLLDAGRVGSVGEVPG